MSYGEALLVAAGGIGGRGRRMWQRRGHLHDVILVAGDLSRSDERPVRELARTLRSEAQRALGCRRAGWLHSAVAALAADLADMMPRTAMRVVRNCDGEPSLPPTSRCIVCNAVIPLDRTMCFTHWKLVPRALQRAIAKTDPSKRHVLQADALAAVLRSSGKVRRPRRGRKPADFMIRPRRSR